MASHFALDGDRTDADGLRSPTAIDRLPEEFVAPLVSGAYVRGIVDTLHLLEIPALFLDGNGRVLATTPVAPGRPLARGLRIRAQHVVAERRSDNHTLSTLIGALLDRNGQGGGREVTATLDAADLTLYGIRMVDRPGACGQLLRAIVLIDDGAHANLAVFAQRMAAKTAVTVGGPLDK